MHSEPLCPHPGVIVGRKGAYRGIHYSAKPFFVIDTAFYLKPKIELDLKWAYYKLLTYDINRMDSGSAIPSTSRDSFYSLPVEIPPVEEQVGLAAILSTLDDKIELNRKMNTTLEAMARAIFKSWFVDFDPVRAKMQGRPYKFPRPQGGEGVGEGWNKDILDLFPDSFQDSPLGEIPKGWQLSTIGEEFNLTMGQSPPGDTYNEVGGGMEFYQGRTDFGFRYPTSRVYCTAPTRRAQAGDTLVSVRAPVGDINLTLRECCIGRGVAAIRHKSGSRSYTYYSMHFLNESFASFEAEGTVFGSIGKNDFCNIKHASPPKELIDAFEQFAYPLDQMIENNEEQSKKLAAIRDALLPKLMSGKIHLLCHVHVNTTQRRTI